MAERTLDLHSVRTEFKSPHYHLYLVLGASCNLNFSCEMRIIVIIQGDIDN